MPVSFRLGMGQMLVKCGDMEGNLDRARAMIRAGADAGCRMVVLPECLDLGWTFPGACQWAGPVPGRTTDAFCQAAIDACRY